MKAAKSSLPVVRGRGKIGIMIVIKRTSSGIYSRIIKQEGT